MKCCCCCCSSTVVGMCCCCSSDYIIIIILPHSRCWYLVADNACTLWWSKKVAPKNTPLELARSRKTRKQYNYVLIASPGSRVRMGTTCNANAPWLIEEASGGATKKATRKNFEHPPFQNRSITPSVHCRSETSENISCNGQEEVVEETNSISLRQAPKLRRVP